MKKTVHWSAYQSSIQIKKVIDFADSLLTDTETSYEYKDGFLIKEEVRLGTVYGKDRKKGVWIKFEYTYTPQGKIETTQQTYYSDEKPLIFLSRNFYNKEGEKIKMEVYEMYKKKQVLSSIYYYNKKEI